MREILFRGKRVDNGEWVEGNYGERFDGEGIVSCISKPTKETISGTLCYDVDQSTVGQYTGLTDKNGKKIFEGDIVQFPIYQGHFRGGNIHQVVFERRCGSAYFGITMDDIETWYFCISVPSKLMEVIGNIHDTPELIGGEKQ